ncbi:hypothetical protein BC833DRAFT_561650 [Globomyces pollinis-pini]|nr:hypothetical protein BC833DRAFT_561650 [Globomyces pollinis-pini]
MFPDAEKSFQWIYGYMEDYLLKISGSHEATALPIISCRANEIVQTVNSINIRNPSLLPIQLAGFLIGILGAFHLYTLGTRSKLGKSAEFWTSFSPVPFLSTKRSGSSSLCLVLTQFTVPKALHIIIFAVFCGLGFFGDFLDKAIPFTGEFIYIGMMLLASLVLLPNLHTIGTSFMGKFISVFGLIVILLGLPLDHIFCEYVGSEFSAVHACFFGSDIAFFGLYLLALSEDEEDVVKKNQ